MKATDIENTININNLPFALSKNSGKKWVLTNTDDQSEIKFDNLAQVDKYLGARIGNSDTVKPEDKLGADAIKMDTSKLVFYNASLNAPIPSAVVDKEATEKLRREDPHKATHIVTVRPFHFETNERGNPCLPEELREVDAIKAEYNRIVDKYCLQFSFRGDRAVSVHHRDILEKARIETHNKLVKCSEVIAAKLDDWKAQSEAKGMCVFDKWPSADYFIGQYNCKGYFTRIDGEFDHSEQVIETAIKKVKSQVQHALESVSAFINGDAKKFRENSIANVVEAVTVLKESGIVSGDTVDQLVERIENVATDFDAEAIRNAKKTIEKGVVVPVQGKRGRKAVPITKEDVETAQKLLDSATDPFAELAEELEGLV
jgi:hypothetical protein